MKHGNNKPGLILVVEREQTKVWPGVQSFNVWNLRLQQFQGWRRNCQSGESRSRFVPGSCSITVNGIEPGGRMAAALSTALQQCYARPLTSSSNTEQRIELIASSKLFAGLSRQCCERIAEQALPRTFDRDELLFMQGDSLRHVMLIRTGSVKITQLSASGNEVILWMYGRAMRLACWLNHILRLHMFRSRH